MIKLVVADDEARVCRLIVALGDWDNLGIQVVGTAANGVEALEMVAREHADILITDIRMPGCSGLELIDKIKNVAPDIKIMIISGYANFEYAQTALKQGVSDYLLKPINKTALNNSLGKMVTQIESEQKYDVIVHNYQRERKEEITKIRNMLFLDLLHNTGLQLTEAIMKEKYYFQIQTGAFQAVVVKRDTPQEKENQNSPELLWNKMKEILEREVPKECYDSEFYSEGEYLYGILNYPAKMGERIRKALRSSFNQMLARNDFLGKSKLSMGLGTMVKRTQEIPNSFLAASYAIAERLLEDTGKVLEIDSDGQILFEKKLIDKFLRNIGSALETLNIEEIKKTVTSLYQETIGTPGVHGWEILNLVCQCGSIFILRMDFSDKQKLQDEFQSRCDNCTTVSELFQYLMDFMLEKIKEIISKREEDGIRPVRLAKQYIHNHYQEQITLEEISDHVGLTPAYFSVLFKKETEIGFARYLINERIEGAKEYLRETNLTVADICRKVGYNDLKHFTRLFEKNVGVKPAVYRKLYG